MPITATTPCVGKAKGSTMSLQETERTANVQKYISVWHLLALDGCKPERMARQ